VPRVAGKSRDEAKFGQESANDLRPPDSGNRHCRGAFFRLINGEYHPRSHCYSDRSRVWLVKPLLAESRTDRDDYLIITHDALVTASHWERFVLVHRKSRGMVSLLSLKEMENI